MLLQPVYIDVFDITHQASPIAIEQICDELEKFGLMTAWLDNYDHAIIVHFVDQKHDIDGELRIDRIRKCFDIAAVVCGDTILPSSGDWTQISDYLRKLNSLLR